MLLVLAFALVQLGAGPLNLWQVLALVVCVGAGAWLGILPFLWDQRAALILAEADRLATAVAQVQNLEQLSAQITGATARWQSVQDLSDQTATLARDVADRMAAEAKAFMEFLQKANDGEKSHLRLEVEKLRRAENDWLQMTVHLLDHVYALHQAGVRSGQASLVQQLGQFQNACRDLVRRAGLVPVAPQPAEAFDAKLHQLADPQAAPPNGATVAEVIAVGYTWQGQLLRRALVALQTGEPTKTESPAAPDPPAGKSHAQRALL